MNDVEELGFSGRLKEIHSELVPLLLEEKQIESSQLLKKSRIRVWSQFVKQRIDKLEKDLRPPQIFDNRVFDELREIRRSHTEAELKIQRSDLSAIDDFRSILEDIDSTNEYAERLRSKSSFDALKEVLKTGIVITATLFGVFLVMGPEYLYWTLAPLGITLMVGAGMFGLIRVYPSISRAHLVRYGPLLIVTLQIIVSLYLATMGQP
ncbi:MAG: hypothetical protein ACFFCP_12175 [Promethearchaeota archaeon]